MRLESRKEGAVTGDVATIGKLFVEPLQTVFCVETLCLSVLWNLANAPFEKIVTLPECVGDWLEHSKFDTPIPHFHKRTILCVHAEERRIGVKFLEIAAYRHALRDTGAVIEFQDRDRRKRILLPEFGAAVDCLH